MRALIYARCSTDEKRQDVEVQLNQLREFCVRNDWKYDEQFEYSSGYKSIPPKLKKIISMIMERRYDVIVVHSLDRFSRLPPAQTEKYLNLITESGCRFVSLQENLDSSQELMWYSFKGTWSYFANQYSKKHSEKVRLGMANAKKKGKKLGRPKGSKDKKQRSKRGYFLRESRKFKL